MRKSLLFFVVIFWSCQVRKDLQNQSFTAHFDNYLYSNWTVETHTFDNNLAHFSADQVKLHNGKLVLGLIAAKAKGKSYAGAEVRSKKKYLYGKFEARMKASNALGCITAFFLYQPNANKNHEIDVEISGKSPRVITTNHWVDRFSHDKDFDLGFDTTTDFHEYIINWTPNKITWEVDGKVIYETNKSIPQKPMHIIFNLWASKSVKWAGDIKNATLPARVEIEYFIFTSYKK